MFTEAQVEIILWAAGLVVLLLGGLVMVVAYFLKELHTDFKGFKSLVQELVTQMAINEEKGKGGYKLLDQRLGNAEEDLREMKIELRELTSDLPTIKYKNR